MNSPEKGLAAHMGPILQAAVFMLALSSLFAGFISGIWLIGLGDWVAIGAGLAAGILMPFAYALVVRPLTGLTSLARRLSERGRKRGLYVLLFLSALYSNLVAASWVYCLFAICVAHIRPETAVPLLLWWYAVAMGPLAYLAREESDEGHGFALTLLLGFAGCVLLATSWLIAAEYDSILAIMSLSLLSLLFSIAGPMVGIAEQRHRFEQAWQKPAR